jgi:hypothetical protein
MNTSTPHPRAARPLPWQICGKFVPAGSPLMLSSWMGQVLTYPQLQHDVGALSPDAWAALEASWGTIRADTLRSEFKPARWLQPAVGQGAGAGPAKPSSLLTFRCVNEGA